MPMNHTIGRTLKRRRLEKTNRVLDIVGYIWYMICSAIFIPLGALSIMIGLFCACYDIKWIWIAVAGLVAYVIGLLWGAPPNG